MRPQQAPKRVSVVTSGLLAVSAWLIAAAFTTPLVRGRGPALYTKAQAERGRVVYDAQCADCHGAALEGGSSTPLAGEKFFANWNRPELSLDDFFYIVRKTMPKDAAGSLSREQYLDVVAFILQKNGFPDGDAELVADPAVMKAVRLEPVPKDTTP